MPETLNHRSRLARQESKQMAKQTIVIFVGAILFLILFLWIGIPGLIKLAIALGNSKSSSKFNQSTDTIPPLPPQMNILPVATTSASLDLFGITESGALVHLFKDGQEIQETTSDNLGNFSFLGIGLTEGTNIFTAKGVDSAGNQSQLSSPQTVNFDNQPPKLTLNKPADKQEFVGATEQFIDISGETDPDSILLLNGRQLVVTGDGVFSTKHQLEDGDNSLKFSATDQAGNKTEMELSVNYSR